MSKPYTADDFSSLVTADRTWRIREISDLKTAIRRADPIHKSQQSVFEELLFAAAHGAIEEQGQYRVEL